MNEIPSPEGFPRTRSGLRGKARLHEHPSVPVGPQDEEHVHVPKLLEKGVHVDAAGPSHLKQSVHLPPHETDAGSLESPSESAPLRLPTHEESELPEFGPGGLEKVVVDNPPSHLPDLSDYVAQVLEIIPDVDPEHALSLVKHHYPESRDRVVELVLHALFENPAYPKLDKKGKRKRVENEDARGRPKPKFDYGNKDRENMGGANYAELALSQLLSDFPLIPNPHIRQTLLDHRSLYAPTHIFLDEEQRGGVVLPYVPKTLTSCPTAKGKRKALHDPEFEKEREWINSRAPEYMEKENTQNNEANADESVSNLNDGIECGCCFSAYSFDKMIQCPDAHLFCTSCMITYAETLLGSHDHRITCMDQSGCKLPFPYAELLRCLTPTLISLYERVKQTKEVEAAGIEGLEACPFCEYKCVIENPEQKLFACRNMAGGCAAVTCRQCKELDHLPRSCKEVQSDENLDGRHVIEEAMTRAFKRTCPNCQKPFIKVEGCNFITCSNCHAHSCYICNTLITDHNHFALKPECSLWDNPTASVKAAANKAIEEYKREHPDIDEEQLKVDLQLEPAPAGQTPKRKSAGGKVRRR
ncbi:hypothetical protein DFH09DRAFT_1208883 [Mycena vulgaris]|nr:hypothetical protein DFH09DRAFT_1208883 [Mycena vulgaris]